MSGRTHRGGSNPNSNSTRGHQRNRHRPYIPTEQEQERQRGIGRYQYDSPTLFSGPDPSLSFSQLTGGLGTTPTHEQPNDTTPTATTFSARSRARRRGITDFSGYNPSMATRPLPPVPIIRRENAFNDKYNNNDDEEDDDGSSCPGSDDDLAPSYISPAGRSSTAATATEPDSGWTYEQIRIEQQVRSRLRDQIQQERERNQAQVTRHVYHNNTDSSCPGSEDESPIIPSSSANSRAGQRRVRGQHRRRVAEGSQAQARSAARAELSDGDESVYTEFEV